MWSGSRQRKEGSGLGAGDAPCKRTCLPSWTAEGSRCPGLPKLDHAQPPAACPHQEVTSSLGFPIWSARQSAASRQASQWADRFPPAGEEHAAAGRSAPSSGSCHPLAHHTEPPPVTPGSAPPSSPERWTPQGSLLSEVECGLTSGAPWPPAAAIAIGGVDQRRMKQLACAKETPQADGSAGGAAIRSGKPGPQKNLTKKDTSVSCAPCQAPWHGACG